VRRLSFLDTTTRTRRDHEKYLTLIEALALLCQHQRPLKKARDEDGNEVEYLEASLDDVAVANRLATEVLGRTLDELPPQSRRFLELLHDMVTERCAVQGVEQSTLRLSRREILDATGWSLRQVRRHLDRLVELEYLLVHRAEHGYAFVYELLWQGQGRHGEPFVIGLADLDGLAAAEGTSTGVPAKEGRSAPLVPPSRSPDASQAPRHEVATNSSTSSEVDPLPSGKPRNAHQGGRLTPEPYVPASRPLGQPAPALAAAAATMET
jgi:hypothetical protein